MKSLKKIVSPEAFLEISNKQSQDFLGIVEYIDSAKKIKFTQILYGHITTEARLLEDFLDNSGAKNNRQWCYFRELIASARTFGFLSYTLLHLLSRYQSYNLKIPLKEFGNNSRNALNFFKDALITIFENIKKESLRLKLTFPARQINQEELKDMPSNILLPNDVGDEQLVKENELILEVARNYHKLLSDFSAFNMFQKYEMSELKKMVPGEIDEEIIREFELRAHNIQSKYDTHIKSTRKEANDKNFKSLRGHGSIALHFLEIASRLIHFYERHEGEIIKSYSWEKIDQLIDKQQVLELGINWALYECHKYLEKGGEVAKKILKRYAQKKTIQAGIPPYRGFHLRPASLVAKIVQYNGAEVKLIIDKQDYDAGSPLALFRTNQQIIAKKRTFVLGKIKPELYKNFSDYNDLREVVLAEVKRLADKGVIYITGDTDIKEMPYLDADNPLTQSVVRDIIKEGIRDLLARDIIDARVEIKVKFKGDQHVLEHIRTLAEHGYGEDENGRDIRLPKQLAYLY